MLKSIVFLGYIIMKWIFTFLFLKFCLFFIILFILVLRRKIMTQKELLYLEDAIGHEKNIISICRDTIQKLENEQLVSFMDCELDKHVQLQEKLVNMLEVKANE